METGSLFLLDREGARNKWFESLLYFFKMQRKFTFKISKLLSPDSSSLPSPPLPKGAGDVRAFLCYKKLRTPIP